MTARTYSEKLLRRFPTLKQFVANPVVMRDLRAQLRGPRAYALMAGYLLLLGVIAVAGYGQAIGQGLNPATWQIETRNIVDAQANLHNFYNFIFQTLALVIVFVAPALTASSVVGERQRQSFDLLVTTPLTAGHLLIGKLISSIAFLGLLLILSLPASALCILLGGAAVGDIFRVYFLLAVDAVVLASIGLYFSCAVRVPLVATVWTYISVIGYFVVTGYSGNYFEYGIGGVNIVFKWLNPITAVVEYNSADTLSPYLSLLVFLMLSGLIVRQLVLAATYRLGLFGAQSAVSLRKQGLVLTGILVFMATNGLIIYTSYRSSDDWQPTFGYFMMILFLVALPFLPGLFVPPAPGSVPGIVDDQEAMATTEPFAFRRLFRPEHRGALPLYVAFVAVCMVAIVAGFSLFSPPVGSTGFPTLADVWVTVLPGGIYILGLGILMWSLCRLAGTLVSDLSSARATAFGFFVAITGLPILLVTVGGVHQDSPLAPIWLLLPVIYDKAPLLMADAMLRASAIATAIAVFVYFVEIAIRQRQERRVLEPLIQSGL